MFATSSSAASTLSSRTSGVSSGAASGSSSSQDSSPAEGGCRQRKFPTLGRPRQPPPATRLARAQSFSSTALTTRFLVPRAPAATSAAYRQEVHHSKFLTSTPLSTSRQLPAVTSTPLSTSRQLTAVTTAQANRQLARTSQVTPARLPAKEPGINEG